MKDSEVTQVQIAHLKEGQGKIDKSLQRLETKIETRLKTLENKFDQMDKTCSVELTKLATIAKVKVALYSGGISTAALLITIIINFFM